MMPFNIVLFNDFETLDVMGPVEIIGQIPDLYELGLYSLDGGIIASSQKVRVDTAPFSAVKPSGVLLISGGFGARTLVNNEHFMHEIKRLSEQAEFVLTVCTGSALLAKTGLLNGKMATSYKFAFEWVCSNGAEVEWMKKARWTRDGKYYTSSGISAGMDMTLGFIRDMHGKELAQKISSRMEYIWNSDQENDPFAIA